MSRDGSGTGHDKRRLESRTLDRLADGLSLLVTVAVAVGVGVLVIYLTSADPATSLRAFFWGPLSNTFFFGNMLQTSAPLIFTGLALVIAFRAGAVNLGAEGQVYVGGLAGAAVLLYAPMESPLMIAVAVAAAAVAGGVLAGFAGWLRTRFGATEVITSFLIGAIGIQLFDYVLRTFLVDPGAGFPATPMFAGAFRLSKLMPPSTLNVSFFLGLAAALLMHFVLFRTTFGYELRMTGANSRFARYAGMPVKWLFVTAMILSGAFAGLAAILELTGVHGRLLTGFSSDLGWNGITVALIARLHPLGVVPAALLYGYLQTGANTASLFSDVSPRIASIIMSLIFYLITAQALYVWLRRRLHSDGRRDATQRPAPDLPTEAGAAE